MKTKNSVVIAILSIFIIILSSCAPVYQEPGEISQNINNQELSETGDLKKFSSKTELMNYLDTQSDFLDTDGIMSPQIGTRNAMVDESVAQFDDTSVSGPANEKSEVAEEFSSTNIQVQGVDEADIVKNDGKYIYTLSGNKLVIINAFPAEDAKILSTVEFNSGERPSEMFLKGEELIVITNSYEEEERVVQGSFVPIQTFAQYTNIYIYNVSNKENPTIDDEYSITGNYFDSRMIDENLYVISSSFFSRYYGEIPFPIIRTKNSIVEPEIFYFDMPSYNYNFNTVAAIDVKNKELNVETYMLAGTGTLYVSKENIYFTHRKYSPYVDSVEAFEEAVLNLLPQDAQNRYNSLKTDNPSISNEDLRLEIVEILEETYNSLEKSEKENLIEEVTEILTEYYALQEQERMKTVVHKISLNNGELEYETKGEFKGYLLNQFSLDEFNGNLRVATTTSFWRRGEGSQSHNNVYVLDENLEVIGELENLAEDERIYSARFMGDKLYMVTFRQIDPLFVIDLENPTSPEVLGELKIPGFSSYLHPFDENYLIGVGSDTKESKWGGVVTNGVKISLFDVSDYENPREVDNYIIEGRFTSTPIEYEHKAFLFDKEKELMVIPVTEVEESDAYYERDIWQGAYVFTVNEEGFDLRGTVNHEKSKDYWYSSPSEVKRSLFMDDVLYTISEKKIMMNNLDDLKELNELNLGYEEEENYYWY